MNILLISLNLWSKRDSFSTVACSGGLSLILAPLGEGPWSSVLRLPHMYTWICMDCPQTCHGLIIIIIYHHLSIFIILFSVAISTWLSCSYQHLTLACKRVHFRQANWPANSPFDNKKSSWVSWKNWDNEPRLLGALVFPALHMPLVSKKTESFLGSEFTLGQPWNLPKWNPQRWILFPRLCRQGTIVQLSVSRIWGR